MAGTDDALPSVGRATTVQRIADLTTELDVEGARRLLTGVLTESPAVAFERARLAIYVGDCEGAAAMLSSPALAAMPGSASLRALSVRCAGAVAASNVIEDDDVGLWIRIQDDEDRALVPFIRDVVLRAREATKRDLNVELPKPLRIELVRDLLSLSAISGLPIEAAETTGTIAVARWGRVTMVSPRATPLGFPWEDTLAHEITHLALSRATRDHAPLWLQEGIAKRQEVRWREPRPFDKTPTADSIAREALETGRSVGVDRLGPSIGMLPSPEAAQIAFAEVESFVDFWIEQNGDAALALLLADLRGVGRGSADPALRSVTGYELAVWLERWQRHLASVPDPAHAAVRGEAHGTRLSREDVVRRLRLGDLLMSSGRAASAVKVVGPAMAAAEKSASIRWRVARARADAGYDPAGTRALVEDVRSVRSVHAGWFAMKSRFEREAGDVNRAARSLQIAMSVDPYREEVACEGTWTPRSNHLPRLFPGILRAGTLIKRPPPPANPAHRALCEAARRMTLD